MKTKRSKRKENLTASQCARILREQLEKAKDDPTVIQDIDGEAFTLKRGEKIFQCYDRKDKIRRHFPKYLFVTTHKKMLSVQGEDSVKWLKLLDGGEYGRPSYNISLKGQVKRVAYYNILALVLGAEAYGTARKLLEKEGLMAIGSKGRLKVNGHHIIPYNKKKAMKFTKYDDAIEFVNNVVHQLLHSMPAINDNDLIKDLDWMYELSRIASEEEPDNATVAYGDGIDSKGNITSKNREIYAVNQGDLVERLYQQGIDVNHITIKALVKKLVKTDMGFDIFKNNGWTDDEIYAMFLAMNEADTEKEAEIYRLVAERKAKESNND